VTRFAPLLALALAACAADDRSGTVVLWHSYGGDERAALDEIVAAANARGDGPRIEAVAVAHGGFADKITSAIPNGNGPDLFIFAHDRLGDWRASGLIEPIEYYVDDALADHYRRQALVLLAQEGSLYGLPMAEKWTALYYNTALVPAPPRSTDELRAIAAALERSHPGVFPLAYQNMELYGHAPWLHAFGGDVIDAGGRPELDTPAAIAALEYTRALARDGIVPPEAKPAKMTTLFNEGDAAMVISGPWFITDAANVPWAIAPLPVVSETGRALRPYYGAEGLIMSARARDKDAAFAVMRLLTGDDAAELRARRAHQLVPNTAVWRLPHIAADKALAAFARQLEQTVPMSGSAAMRQVWAPYERVLQNVIVQGAHAGDELASAEREVIRYLQGAE
jgi:arabinogalactan oligomer/maltooligosaccharide transport system permease protein